MKFQRCWNFAPTSEIRAFYGHVVYKETSILFHKKQDKARFDPHFLLYSHCSLLPQIHKPKMLTLASFN